MYYNEYYFYNQNTKKEGKCFLQRSLSAAFLQKGSKLLACRCLSLFQKRLKGAFLPVSALITKAGNISRVRRGPLRSSLVVQWLGIHLPMQGMWVQSLVREDPTCLRAIKPVHHNY